MEWKDELRTLWRRLSWTGTAPFSLPNVLLEIQPAFVMAARLTGKAGSSRQTQVARLSHRFLEPGIIAPLPAGPVVTKPEALAKLLDEVVQAVGNGQTRVGLLVPDGAARVGVFSFETLPPKKREAATLIKWRMRDSLPYDPQEGRVSYQTVPLHARGAALGELEVSAIVMRHSVAQEFETVMESANRSAALLLPASAALLPLVSANEGSGGLVVHVCSEAATLAVVEGSRLRFWRSHDYTGMTREEIHSQVAAEAARVLASSEDRLGLSVNRILLCDRAAAGEEWVEGLARTLGHPVEDLAVPPEPGSLLTGEESANYRRFGAPIAGLIANIGAESSALAATA